MSVELPINSVLTVRHEYKLGSDVSFNVLHYRLASATVISTGLPLATTPLAEVVVPNLAAAAYLAWAGPWQACVSEEVTYTSCTAQKVYVAPRSTPYTYVPDPASEGIVAGDSLPMQDCVTLLKKTGVGERWGQGRVFISGIAEEEAINGLITDDLLAPLAALASTLDEDIVVLTGGVNYAFRPVITNVPTTDFPRVTDITSGQLSDKVIKTQRRRRPGKGI